MKRKWIAVLLAMAVMLSATACGGENNQSSSSPSSESEETADAAIYGEHFSLSSAEVQYLYQYFYNSYAPYFEWYGVDETKSLKEQEYYEGKSWFDMIMDQAVSYGRDILAFCEEANRLGYTVTDEDMEEIDANIQALEEEGAALGYEDLESYFSEEYGILLTKEEYREYMKKNELANQLTTDLLAGYSCTDEEIESYYEAHEKEFTFVDYLTFTFSPEEGGLTAEECETAVSRLEGAQSEEEFRAVLSEYTSAEDGELLVTKAGYMDSDAFSNWAFSSGKAGEVYTVTDDDSQSSTVYFLLTDPYRDESKTVNVRHVLLSPGTYGGEDAALEKAEELLNSFDGTEESFIELAKQYSEDSNAAEGGLYENVKSGEMVDEFNDWIFGERAAGDHDIVETDYGYHLMYYVGDGDPAWKADVRDAMLDEDYDEDYTRIVEAANIATNEELIDEIEG